jgi:hypothetical protein
VVPRPQEGYFEVEDEFLRLLQHLLQLTMSPGGVNYLGWRVRLKVFVSLLVLIAFLFLDIVFFQSL